MEPPNPANYQACPVCLGRVQTELFANHMSSHSKDEVLAALLRQTPGASPAILTPAPQPPPTSVHQPSTSTAGPSIKNPYSGLHFLATAARELPSPAPVMVPQMMGMSMVMSPVLIPQQNGPPIIFNVPSYVYPNLLNSSASNINQDNKTTVQQSTPIPSGSTVKIEVQQPPLKIEVPQITEQTLRSVTPGTSIVPNAIPAGSILSRSIAPSGSIIQRSITPVSIVPKSPVPGPSRIVDEMPASILDEREDLDLDEDPDDPIIEVTSPGSPTGTPQKICSVETVSDLMNAQMLLKSNEDIQIVVANDLLETNEFKAFMSHLNLPAQQNETKLPNQVPPNTPMNTRPSSAAPPPTNIEDEELTNEDGEFMPQPSTSRSNSHDSSPDILDVESDDEICLKVRIILCYLFHLFYMSRLVKKHSKGTNCDVPCRIMHCNLWHKFWDKHF